MTTKSFPYWCLFAALLLCPAGLFAGDAEGCKDSLLIARMPGSTLDKCGHQDSNQVTMPVRKNKGKDVVDQTVEGEYWSWGYLTRNGVSESDVFRSVKEMVKQAGFEVDYEDAPERLTAHKGNIWYSLENRGEYYKQVMVTAKN